MKTLLIASAILGVLIAPASAATKHHKHQTTAAYTAEAPVDQASADGYHRASGYEQVKAECELVANGLQPSPGFVIGSREYVAGAAVGSAIGGLIVHAKNYQNCMTLKGYAHN
jgi:hypothetical protein